MTDFFTDLKIQDYFNLLISSCNREQFFTRLYYLHTILSNASTSPDCIAFKDFLILYCGQFLHFKVFNFSITSSENRLRISFAGYNFVYHDSLYRLRLNIYVIKTQGYAVFGKSQQLCLFIIIGNLFMEMKYQLYTLCQSIHRVNYVLDIVLGCFHYLLSQNLLNNQSHQSFLL